MALLGCAYAWLALQPNPTQPLLALGALSKLGFFAIGLTLWLVANASTLLIVLGVGEALLALLWLQWLRASRRSDSSASC